MLISLCAFSITLAASATLMLLALNNLFLLILPYIFFNRLTVLELEPEIILVILFIVCVLSPGFILSGEYPIKKFLLRVKFFFKFFKIFF